MNQAIVINWARASKLRLCGASLWQKLAVVTVNICMLADGETALVMSEPY